MSSLWFWLFTLILFFLSRFVSCLLFHSNSSLVISFHMLFATFALNFIFLQNLRKKEKKANEIIYVTHNHLHHANLRLLLPCFFSLSLNFLFFISFILQFMFCISFIFILCLILCKSGQACCYFLFFLNSLWSRF